MKKIVQKVVVGGALLNDNKILIVQRASDEDIFPGMWELPSGKKEPMEDVNKALVREFKEETGLDVEVGDPIGVINYSWEKEDEIRDATQINFVVTLVGGPDVKLSSEHQNFAWITKDEINNYEISDETKGIIRKAL